ncbi:MAG TPA: aminotransferase class IV [Vicinamibacterales bacterium]|jgi:branched-chain amino acid aminotransferase|nr:aminotransferase class IV [Vicinamibacterales bacterium]
MNAVVNVNGRIGDAREPLVPVFDHGFLYGEGVYETLRTYERVPFLFDRHVRRLRASAEMIALNVPLDDRQLLERVEATMAALPGSGEAYIRILVTRGVGDLSYDLSATPTPSVVIIVKPFVSPAARTIEQGIAVATVSVLRNHPSSVNPLIKSNNLLNNALAMQEAIRKGAEEAVMRNYRGELAECSQSNLFIVRSGAALTPALDAGLLPGITRAFVIEIGRDIGVPVSEATLRLEDLLGADEAFVTGTTRELTPVVRVDDRQIGSGKPGPITKRLLEAFHKRALEIVRRPQPQPQS